MARDPRREVDRLAEEMQAVIQSVRREVRGKPVADAQRHLEESLRSHGMWLPRSVSRNLARHMADPWWPMKHPFGFWQEIREARREAMVDQTQIETANQEMDEHWSPGSKTSPSCGA